MCDKVNMNMSQKWELTLDTSESVEPFKPNWNENKH